MHSRYLLGIALLGVSFFLLTAPLHPHAMAEKPVYRMQKNLDCDQTSDHFVVTFKKNANAKPLIYSHSIVNNGSTFDMDCGWNIAGAYDGAELMVFDRTTEFFYESTIVEKNSNAVELAAGSNIVALYDGYYFVVFDSNRKDFLTYPAVALSSEIFLSAGEDVAVLSDGESMIVYDSRSGMFSATSVFRPGTIHVKPVAIAGKNAALAYDGKQVYAYCPGSHGWKIFPAKENLSLTPYTDLNGTTLSLFQANEQYNLNFATCTIQ